MPPETTNYFGNQQLDPFLQPYDPLAAVTGAAKPTVMEQALASTKINPGTTTTPGLGVVGGTAGDLSLEAMANKAAADAGTTFGIDNRSLSAGMDVANLGLGILNYADSKKMNKKTMAGMDQNLKNAQTEADATAKYRAAYGA